MMYKYFIFIWEYYLKTLFYFCFGLNNFRLFQFRYFFLNWILFSFPFEFFFQISYFMLYKSYWLSTNQHHHLCTPSILRSIICFRMLFFVPCILHRWIQLPQSRSTIQARILILLNSNLYPMLYAGNCLMGVILARSRCCTSSCVLG